jgi:ATP-binding cassette, subfamily B, bacterial MsbA
MYYRLLSYVSPYWRIFGLSILAMALLGATEPALPALMKPLLDGTFVTQDLSQRLVIPSLIVLLFLVRGGLGYASDVTIQWVAQSVVRDLRNDMFQRLIVLSTEYYDQHASGELISKLTYDTAQVAEAATRSLTVLVKDLLAALGLFGYILYLNWRLSSALFLLAPLLFGMLVSVSKRLRAMNRDVQQAMGAISSVAQEAIDCHKVVKVFGGQRYEFDRFRNATAQAQSDSLRVIRTAAASSPIIQTTVATLLAVLTFLAASESASGKMTVGDFVSFITAMTLLIQPLRRLGNINENLQRGLAAAESAFALIDTEAERDTGTVVLNKVNGQIVIRELSLIYPQAEKPALNAVSFSIAPGETVALVGASGSGKSSLAGLIVRFYQPSHGEILIDGINIDAISLPSLRNNIALVNQEVMLFNDTIRNNIAYGAMQGASAAAIAQAAKAAKVTDFAEQLPQGMDTLVGEDGLRLSGGQRQRIAIARALLKSAPILILDEATSSLDSASERHIQDALEQLRRGRTCLIIAHRLSTIESADRIVVLQEGRIVESGTHADLLQQTGVYRHLTKSGAAGLH